MALKKPCNLGTSILMTEPGGLHSLDGDSAPCSRQAWRLAAWMVILQPAGDSKWICVDFTIWECSGGAEGFPACDTGLHGSRSRESITMVIPLLVWGRG